MADETLVATIRADLTAFQAAMRQMVSEVQRASQQSTQHVTSLDRSMQTLATTAKTVGVAFAAMGIAQLGKEAIQASTQMTALDNAFKAITGSATAAKAELGFVRAESLRLGLNFVSAAEQFKNLAAAARGTTLEGQATREVFTAVAAASRTLGLSADNTKGVLAALTKIISTGTVQSDELRGMLAERLPGGFQIAARAMGVTTAALNKMLEQGEVLSTDFIPKFAAQLEKELGGGAAAASQTFQAAMERMGTATTDLGAAFGDMITKNPQIIQGINDIAAAITRLAATIRTSPEIQAFGTWLGTVFEANIRAVNNALARTPEALKLLDIQTEAIGEQERLLASLQKTAERLKTQGPLSGLSDFSTQVADELQEVERQIDQAIKKLIDLQGGRAQLQTQFIRAAKMTAPIEELDTSGMRTAAGLRDLIQGPGLERLAKATEQYTKLKTEIAATQKLLADAKGDFLPMDPEQVVVLEEKLKGLEDQLKKTLGQMTSKEVAAESKRLFAEQARDAAAHAKQTIDLMRDREEADEKLKEAQAKLNDERIADALHAEKTIQGFRDKFAAEALKTQEDLDKDFIAIRKAAAEQQIKDAEKAQEDFERFQEQVSDKVGDVLFDFTKSLTDGSTKLKDIWKETLTTIQDLFLRTLTEMAARALVSKILIPVGVTSGTGGTAGAGTVQYGIAPESVWW